ncbi:hypothetical protein ACIP5N_21190 [Streptomyces sp. NPDC088768]|uniref:hypothetical protein n=1 Tax=Streptomyces sp. NPDC088768 TaxID=3365894 RepID=UPI00382D0547
MMTLACCATGLRLLAEERAARSAGDESLAADCRVLYVRHPGHTSLLRPAKTKPVAPTPRTAEESS